MSDLVARVAQLETDIKEIKANDARQSEQIESIKADTSELVELFRAGTGTVKTFKWCGKVIVWMGSVASGVYALWFAITNWPHKGG